MARSRESIIALVVAIVTLSAMSVAMVQDATAQETPLPNARAYLKRGITYRGKGDNDRAIADFTQAIQLDPKSTQAYVNRGFAYDDKGDDDRAIADYSQAIQLDPKCVQIIANYASSVDSFEAC
jgi:Tfp pilus assembly protein PilF